MTNWYNMQVSHVQVIKACENARFINKFGVTKREAD